MGTARGGLLRHTRTGDKGMSEVLGAEANWGSGGLAGQGAQGVLPGYELQDLSKSPL